jgi:hypothetical protein
MSFFQAVEQVNIAVSPRADLQIGIGKPKSSFFGRNRKAINFPSLTEIGKPQVPSFVWDLKALVFFLWQKPESP